MHLPHCFTWGFCLHSYCQLIISKSQPDSYWNYVPEYICSWVTLPINSPFYFSFSWVCKLFVCVCVCVCVWGRACVCVSTTPLPYPVWSSLKPYASVARSLALNSNVLASIHGYTSVILNHTKRESSDFPAGFALCGLLAATPPPSHWVAQKRIMARGRKLRWCNHGPRAARWDNDSALTAFSSPTLFFLVEDVTFLAQMWFDKSHNVVAGFEKCRN